MRHASRKVSEEANLQWTLRSKAHHLESEVIQLRHDLELAYQQISDDEAQPAQVQKSLHEVHMKTVPGANAMDHIDACHYATYLPLICVANDHMHAGCEDVSTSCSK